MNSNFLLYALLIILTASATTILLRAFPFIAFGRSKETPPVIRYLGSVISPAAIAMLCVFCFCSHWQALQIWKRNPLLSILAGTVIYMILVQNF